MRLSLLAGVESLPGVGPSSFAGYRTAFDPE